jgi:Protein of unknown function (DUF2380)
VNQDQFDLACKPTFGRYIVADFCWITMMRSLAVFMLLSSISLVPAYAADPPRLAVFDFEMIDSSLPGEVYGPRADEHDRLLRVGDQVRKELGESGKFQILDIAPVNAAAHQSHLQACGGCDLKLAKQLEADLEITGVVQKVSNLILNINVYLRDVHTGRLLTVASADMRGNTDESWSRTTRYLIRERLLAPNFGAPQVQ